MCGGGEIVNRRAESIMEQTKVVIEGLLLDSYYCAMSGKALLGC